MASWLQLVFKRHVFIVYLFGGRKLTEKNLEKQFDIV